MSAAERIRSLRLHYGFTHKDVVERSGLSKSEVSKLEAGALKGTSPRHRRLLGRAFGIAPRDIGLYLEGDKSFDEVLPVQARKTPLEEAIALGMRDRPSPWAPPTLAAARELELGGVQLSRTEWVAKLGQIEAAMRAALPSIWERLVRDDVLDGPRGGDGVASDGGSKVASQAPLRRRAEDPQRERPGKKGGG
jgi:transcriptional regulator with XRE-family HTH domain